jgi:PAS domain S-box-containing protein
LGGTGLENHLGNILDTIAEGIEIIGADGRYTFANLAAANMFGPRNELIGRHYDEPRWTLTTVAGEPLPAEEMPQSRVMRTGEPVVDVRYGALLPDGRKIMMRMNAVPFKDDEGRLVGTLVSYADITQRMREESFDHALIEIAAAVNSSFDFDTILQRALDLAVGALDCESGILFLKDGTDWVVHCLTNLPAEMSGVRVPEEDASFTTLTGGKAGAIAFNDAQDDDRISSRVMRQFQITSLLDVTLRVRGRDIGDMSLIYHTKKVAFTEIDVAFANKFGAIVSLALESSQLFRGEQETARILQTALLGDPAKISGIEFSLAYRSITESAVVGGDFYDLFETDHDHVAVLLGDVSGHGLSKATIAALAKHTMEAYLFEGEMPMQVLDRTNRVVARLTDDSTFITAVVAVLDRASGTFEYCNAAQPDPLLLRRDGSVEKLAARSQLLGAFPSATFESACIDLAPGDVVLLYTDGVTEARGAGGTFFGDERLATLLARSARVSVRHLADHIMKAVQDFATGSLSDDVAILALARVSVAPSKHRPR